MSEKQKHRDHSRKVALRVAESLIDKWPTLHLEGFDIDEAARLIAMALPLCMIEAEIVMAECYKRYNDDPHRPGDPDKGIINRLRAALGVEDVTAIQAIDLAIQRLNSEVREFKELEPRRNDE